VRPDCQQCQDWMEDAFSGELKPELKPALDSHLAACEECRAGWEDYRLLRRGLDALAENEDGPSPFVEAKILRAAAARNAKSEAPSGFWRWLLRPATISFATLALILGLGYLGREELLRHRQAENLTAPVAPAPQAPKAIPATSLDSFGASEPAPAKPSATAPAPVTPLIKKSAPDAKAKASTEARDSAVQRQELQQQATQPAAAPVPPPAEEKGRALSAPSSGAAANGAGFKDEVRAREASIPEAELAAPPTPRQDTEKTVQSGAAKPKPSEQAQPAKTLQRAPQPGAPAGDLSEGGIGGGSAPKELPEGSKLNQLLQSAKAKIKRQEYASALDDLLAAQKIQDTKEIQDLILLCRSHLRGDG